MTQSQNIVLHLLEICYNKLTFLEQDALLVSGNSCKKNSDQWHVLYECPPYFSYGTIAYCTSHEAGFSGSEPTDTQWTFSEGRGSNLIGGMQEFSSGNTCPGTLVPMFT